MLKPVSTINDCNHYLLKNNRLIDKIGMSSLRIQLNPDTEITSHPCGVVYKNKKVVDSPLRYVVQKDGTILVFNVYEWHNETNPFSCMQELIKSHQRRQALLNRVEQIQHLMKSCAFKILGWSSKKSEPEKQSKRFKLI